MKNKKIILAAGGTGGHIFPAEALAEELILRGYKPVLITDKRGSLYSSIFRKLEHYTINVGNFNSSSFFIKLFGFYKIIVGIFSVSVLLSRLRPEVAIGFGGYPSLPTMLAAKLLGTPTTIHEQNAVLGRVNRLLSKRVNSIALSYSETLLVPHKAIKKCHFTGNPIRSLIRRNESKYEAIKLNEEIKIVIFGGSQGSSIFSRVLPKGICKLSESFRKRLKVVQQCRAEDVHEVKKIYNEFSINYEISEFFDDLGYHLSSSHLVIARSGASSVAEIAALGRPSILIPYAKAKDDHQYLNACLLKNAGAAWVVSEEDFKSEKIVELLNQLFSSPKLLRRAALSAFNLDNPAASKNLADMIENLSAISNLKENIK